MTSIRRFLLAGVLAALTLFSFIAPLRGYRSSMAEVETLFDAHLLDASKLVANLDMARITRQSQLGDNLAFQVWEDGKLLAASSQAPSDHMAPLQQGFDFANFDGYRWRTYSWFDESTQRWIMAAERTDQRFALAENVVLETVLPILLGIPVTGLLIWLIVSQGLKPLTQLSSDLQKKPAHDLSELPLRATPKELVPVVNAVNGLIHRLGAALEREKRLSADAAHELRTPITALKIQLHNLAQEVDAGSESFRQLEQGVERMGHLVEQLMSLYRTSPEQFTADCTDIDLHALAQELVARMYPLFEARQQTLELLGKRCMMRGEPFALETLLANLLTNASKYTPLGGRVQVNVEAGDAVVVLKVQDNGAGISAEDKARIFERFYRVDRSSNAGPGCGLGLTIVQHVAALHQATVSVHASEFGSGAAFTVIFPALMET